MPPFGVTGVYRNVKYIYYRQSTDLAFKPSMWITYASMKLLHLLQPERRQLSQDVVRLESTRQR